MPNRSLYIAAYDIADPARLRAALHTLKAYASGGQKSVFECFLTPAERAQLLAEVRGILNLTFRIPHLVFRNKELHKPDRATQAGAGGAH